MNKGLPQAQEIGPKGNARIGATRITKSGEETSSWHVPVEVPVAFIVASKTVAIMLATPDDLEDYAAGFALTDGLINDISELKDIRITEKAKGIDILMEQHGSRRRSTDFRRGQRLGQRDHLLVIDKPKIRPGWMSEAQYDAAPASITVRECKVAGKIMVTTMSCPKTAPKAALKALYKSRWNVELDIRHIKDTMGMNILSCKTPDMVIKEIWVYLLAYNLIRLMMLKSALLADITPRSISFKHCLQLWLLYVQKIDVLDQDQLATLFLLMSQQRVGNRPGRIEPRAVKRRPKAFPLLTKPRDQAREEVRKYGHPKKLK